MSHLPAELVFAILEHAYYTPAGTPDYRLLTRCALVCTTWTIAAQSLLFTKPPKLQSHTAPLFQAALASSSARVGKSMGHLVRSLDMYVGEALIESCQPDTLIQLLEACPALYELTLRARALHGFDQATLAKLEHAGQGIQALNLESYDAHHSPVLFQLLGIWPRIRFLKVGTEMAAWPWRHQGRPQLAHHAVAIVSTDNIVQRLPSQVALYDLMLTRTPHPAMLERLLASSSASLRILDLRDYKNAEIPALLSVHAPCLRSLRLIQINTHALDLLRQCTQLEELVLYNIPVFVMLAPVIPRTIEHLSFRNPNHSFQHTLRPILDAIEVLPKLRIVTCDNNSERLRGFALLKTICAERGVEVVISEVPFTVYEDPVAVRRFPRRYSVSNFRMMTNEGGRD